jgi:8-oxo-dGTP pyrophosphatase MutT (NUDIX family)
MKFKKEVSAGGIVYKKNGSETLWLITQHSQNHNWSFPKGIIGDIHENEKIEEAALREVGEEGGIKAQIVSDAPITVQYKYKFDDTLVDKTVHYFLMEYVSGDPKDHDWEVEEAKFLTADELKKQLSYKGDREAFEKMIQTYEQR